MMKTIYYSSLKSRRYSNHLILQINFKVVVPSLNPDGEMEDKYGLWIWVKEEFLMNERE